MRVLVTLITLSSFSAFAACPKLAGTYASCRSTTGTATGSTDVVITQALQNGVTVYTVTSTDDESQERGSEEIIADGKTRTESVNSELGLAVASIKYSCSGKKVLGNQSLTIDGASFFELDVEIERKGSIIKMAQTGSIFGQAFEDTLICE